MFFVDTAVKGAKRRKTSQYLSMDWKENFISIDVIEKKTETKKYIHSRAHTHSLKKCELNSTNDGQNLHASKIWQNFVALTLFKSRIIVCVEGTFRMVPYNVRYIGYYFYGWWCFFSIATAPKDATQSFLFSVFFLGVCDFNVSHYLLMHISM